MTLKKQQPGDALAKLIVDSLISDAQALVERASSIGLVLTIENAPVEPLAMGNYEPVIAIRAGKKLYRGEA
jgi:hypothetical protein